MPRPRPDIRLIDRLRYQFNGAGFVDDRFSRLWLVDVDGGGAELLTRGDHHDDDPRWSPDGRSIAFVSDRHPNPDLGWRSDIYVVTVSTRTVRQLSPGRGRQAWGSPEWSPDGKWIAAIGNRDWKRGQLDQASVWRFRVRDGEAEELTAGSDLEAAAAMNSDLVGGARTGRSGWPMGGGSSSARRSMAALELWRVEIDGGRIERLTRDRHYVGRHHLVTTPRGGARVAAVRTSGTEVPNVVVGDIPRASRRQ
jgi:dipeptidyl aminopeptidase/acylaminoacyl peptidase